ncbi:MAG: hypothetical protein M1371_09390 [Actinobacteria bacterium]|nr:hypothetical protein [Actinomycetota bacterium]
MALPKESLDALELSDGSFVDVEIDVENKRMIVSPVHDSLLSQIDQEFQKQLDDFIALYRPALETLAK